MLSIPWAQERERKRKKQQQENTCMASKAVIAGKSLGNYPRPTRDIANNCNENKTKTMADNRAMVVSGWKVWNSCDD